MMNRPILITLFLILISTTAAFAQRNGKLSDSRKAAPDVTFRRAEALSDGNGVFLRWTVLGDRDLLGFDVLRASAGQWKKAGTGFVPGKMFQSQALRNEGGTYTFFDPEGGYGSLYQVRARLLSGESVTTGVITTGFEADFFSQTGKTSRELKEAALSAEPLTINRGPAWEYSGVQRLANLPPNLPQQHWVAARPGVKIGVRENGLYRITRTELENAGFDVNADESLWQLYLDGNEQSIIVDGNGDYIEFFGKGIDTPATNTNVYFLVVGDGPGQRIDSVFRKPNGANTAQNYRENFYRRDRAFYIANIINGDKENFFGQVITPTPVDVEFNIDEVDHSVPKTYIQVGVNGFTAGFHKISVSVNGVPLGSFSFNGATYKMADIGVPTQIINEGLNTVQMAGTASGSDISLVEFVAAQYPRGYVARTGGLEFPVPNLKQVTVTGFADANIRVFDMTSPDHPKLVSNTTVESLGKLGTAFQVVIPSSKASPMFAVDDAGIKSAASLEFNEPSTLNSVSNAWKMAVISHADFLTEAEAWASYRTTEGISSVAVDVVDVYDEFGFGRRGPDAIREFIHYARLNWSTPLAYAMLVGDATYDPRNYTGAGGTDFVPTDMIETTRDESPSDESMADFNEDGLSELSIGRVPASTPTQVSDVLTKVTTFESSIAAAPDRGALCASDVPQIVNFQEICNRVIDGLPESIPVTDVNKADPDSRNTLLAEISEGKYVVNYSGHGSVISWTGGSFFGTGDVPGLTNQNDLSVFTMLTCLNGYFTNPATLGLSERLFLATNGGAVATWASTGETTPDVQEILATRFYLQLGTNPSLSRIGDLVKDAKTAVAGSRDVRLSWHLLADPAMRLK